MVKDAARSFLPTTDLLSASPDTMFRYFLFHRWDVFLDDMRTPEKVNVDTAIASLLSTCTDKKQREEFYKSYLDLKAKLAEATDNPAASAAILTAGDFFAYIAVLCEFVEEETGGIA